MHQFGIAPLEFVQQLLRIVDRRRIGEETQEQPTPVRHRREVERRPGQRPERVVGLHERAADEQVERGGPDVGTDEVDCAGEVLSRSEDRGGRHERRARSQPPPCASIARSSLTSDRAVWIAWNRSVGSITPVGTRVWVGENALPPAERS